MLDTSFTYILYFYTFQTKGNIDDRSSDLNIKFCYLSKMWFIIPWRWKVKQDKYTYRQCITIGLLSKPSSELEWTRFMRLIRSWHSSFAKLERNDDWKWFTIWLFDPCHKNPRLKAVNILSLHIDKRVIGHIACPKGYIFSNNLLHFANFEKPQILLYTVK